MSYILVDTANLMFRAKHVVHGNDVDEKIGMAMHIIFTSVAKTVRDFSGSHIVFCFEGRSWRKDFYTPYKANRQVKRDALTPQEQADDAAFFEGMNGLRDFLSERTNATVLQAEGCEADDFIARWIQTHPDDDHVIVSSDSDFYQLLTHNVTQYNGITNEHITVDGVFDERGRIVKDKKTGEQKQIGEPSWLLFEKCIRGDSADNIFSAYPRAPKKGTKNKVGMLDAFNDKDTKGYNWNNFMLQRWVDHNEEEHLVLDDYNRNVALIDLTAQPKDIIVNLDTQIIEAVQAEPLGQVGLRFMKFCGKYNLVRLGESSAEHARYLGASYAKKASN